MFLFLFSDDLFLPDLLQIVSYNFIFAKFKRITRYLSTGMPFPLQESCYEGHKKDVQEIPGTCRP
jgi:hypothetical protein